jgi:cell division protein FtsZ
MNNFVDAGSPLIKIFGFGGAGCNTLSNLNNANISQIELIAANTDFFTLTRAKADHKIRLGEQTCKGLGAGGDTRLGRLAAEESFRAIIHAMQGASLVFLTAGLGGGTGSGAIEIAARIAMSLNIPSISFVSLPFSFESESRKSIAYESSLALQPFTNTLLTIPNDKMLEKSGKDLPMHLALQKADAVMINCLAGLMDLIDHSTMMHIDLSYILNAVQSGDGIYISKGTGAGPDRVQQAVNDVLGSSIFSAEQFQLSKEAILKITGNVSAQEVDTACHEIRQRTSPEIEITPIIADPGDLHGTITISLLLNGLGATPMSYPISWMVPHAKEKSLSMAVPTEVMDTGYSSAEDYLEIPAFIRKGYNLKNRD